MDLTEAWMKTSYVCALSWWFKNSIDVPIQLDLGWELHLSVLKINEINYIPIIRVWKGETMCNRIKGTSLSFIL